MKNTKDYALQVNKVLKNHNKAIYRAVPIKIIYTILLYFTKNICLTMIKNEFMYFRGHMIIYPDIRKELIARKTINNTKQNN